MAEHWQPMIGNPEPLWSFQAARALGAKVRAMSELHPGIARELCEAAAMIEHLAFCTDSYRERWVETEWKLHDLRNTPRHEAQEKNDGKRDE